MKTKIKSLLKMAIIPAAFAALFAVGNANATVDDELSAVTQFNLLEDDSGELVFRSDGLGGYDLVTAPGTLTQGDYVLGMFDLPIINGTNIDTLGFELTGVFLFEVTSISGAANDADVTFGAVGSTQIWNDITDLVDGAGTGINLGALGVDATNLAALFWEDAANNLNVSTNAVADGTAYNNTVDGSLMMALDMGTATADGIETDLATIAAGTPGVTIVGNFDFDLNVQLENFATIDPNKYVGSGTNLTSFNPEFAVANDFQGALFSQVPEPATLALLGLGVLGMAGTLRRRKTS